MSRINEFFGCNLEASHSTMCWQKIPDCSRELFIHLLQCCVCELFVCARMQPICCIHCVFKQRPGPVWKLWIPQPMLILYFALAQCLKWLYSNLYYTFRNFERLLKFFSNFKLQVFPQGLFHVFFGKMSCILKLETLSKETILFISWLLLPATTKPNFMWWSAPLTYSRGSRALSG